jgi:hypothetical protein
MRVFCGDRWLLERQVLVFSGTAQCPHCAQQRELPELTSTDPATECRSAAERGAFAWLSP